MSRKTRRNRNANPSITPTTQPTRNFNLLPLGALAAGFGLAMPAWSQTAPDTSASATETTLAEVSLKTRVEFEDKKNVQAVTSSIGKGNQEIRDIPQSLNVVTEKLLDDRKADSLQDALRLTAGVTFSAAENGTQPDTFIRGFSVAQVGDLLIDGMKDPSQYERDTFNYDRIEVLRGSASMIFGRGSTGGVINQVAKKPLLADIKEVVATVGSGDYGRITADFNMRTSEHTAVRVNGMYTKADNFGAKIDKKGLAPSFAFGVGTNHEFNIGLFYLKTDLVPRNGLSYAIIQQFPDAVDPNDFYGAASDYHNGEAKYGTFQYKLHLANGGQLNTQVRTGTYDRSLWLTVARTPANATTVNSSTVLTRGGLTPRSDTYKGTYLQSDYSQNIEWLGMKHAVLAGVDAAHESADRYINDPTNVIAGTPNITVGTRANTTIGTPDDGYYSRIVPRWIYSNDYVSRNAGIFVQDLVEFVPHWKLLLGLRHDYIKGEFNNRNATTGVITSATLEDSVLSHRAAVLFQPTSTLSFHLGYGTSFNTSGDTYQFTGILANTANTPPEKSRNIELGAKADWFDGNLSTRLALFRTEKYNERTTDADVSSEAYLLSGKRHSAGWELEVAGRPHEDVEVYLSYAFIPTSRIDKAGTTQQNIVGQPFGLLPKKSGSSWVTYQVSAPLRVGVGATWSSRNYAINGTTPTRANYVPGYAVVDALAEYFLTPDLFVQLNGSNLTDKTYSYELYRGHTILGMGRNFKFTVGYTF